MIFQLTKDRKDYLDWLKKADDICSAQKARICTDKYIVPFQTEITKNAQNKSVYRNRLSRTYPLVLSPGIIAQHVSTANQTLSISGFEGPQAELILDDVDGYGKAAQHKFCERLYYYLRDGQVGCFVESPDSVSSTLEEAIQTGERSFQRTVTASEILHLEYFGLGPNIGQIFRLQLDGGTEKRGEKTYQIIKDYEVISPSSFAARTWEKDQEGLEGEYKLANEFQVNADRIPFVVFGEGPEDSALWNILDADIALVNRISVLSNINYYQGFKLIFLFGITDREEIAEIGESRIQTFASDGSLATSEAGDPTAVQDEIKFLFNWIKRTGFHQHNTMLDEMSKQVQSADSREKDLIVLEAFYNETLDMFSRKEKDVYRLHSEYEGLSSDNVSVNIRRDFGLGDSQAKLALASYVMANASRFSPGGVELEKEIIASLIERLDLTVSEGEDEQAVKARLKDSIRASTVSDPFTAPRSSTGPNGQATLANTRQSLF